MEVVITQSAFRRFIFLNVVCNRKFVSTLAANSSAIRKVYEVSPSLSYSNWVIKSLCRDGSITGARKVFDEMPVRDESTWTLLITGYLNWGFIQEARSLFDRDDAVKDVVTWTAMINGYARLNLMRQAEFLFEEMPHRNVISWNTMIQGYVKSGRVNDACKLFASMPERNVTSYNTIINGLMESGRVAEARTLFGDMGERNIISWTTMVNGLANNNRIEEAREIFDAMPTRSVISWNAMINGYVRNNMMDEAHALFKDATHKNASSWNVMITGYLRAGNLSIARKLFDEMPERNTSSWTAVITGYNKIGENEEALKIFARFLAEHDAKPNDITFVSALAACSELAVIREGQQIHQLIIKTGHTNTRFITSSLIELYSKCGELKAAKEIFDKEDVDQRDVVSWNAMIAGCAIHGCAREAIEVFEEMKRRGFEPNDVSYLEVLCACSHKGMVKEGIEYFEDLVREKGIVVREVHWWSLVDIYERGGNWRVEMKKVKGKKQPGCSWIGIRERIYVFMVGDVSSSMLHQLHSSMREIPLLQ